MVFTAGLARIGSDDIYRYIIIKVGFFEENYLGRVNGLSLFLVDKDRGMQASWHLVEPTPYAIHKSVRNLKMNSGLV